MSSTPPPRDGALGLFTDLYELTMLQAYLEEGMHEPAVFSLFVRRLPAERNYLLACGLDAVLTYLERLRFDPDDIGYLASLGRFSDRFLAWLAELRFTGDVHAVPEGTPVFANEPILELTAPLPEAQVVETYLLNQIHGQTLLASKAARLVEAARGRNVVDFGARRAHGVDAAMMAARASYMAGAGATSNLLAGRQYGLPVAGTMAHSYIQAHEHELDAFRAFAGLYPRTILLVDTYDTLDGVQKVIELSRSAPQFDVAAVRLDSGDLGALAREARERLDAAGLQRVGIFASGGLDEMHIATLVNGGAPIEGFGVGSSLATSDDAPALDIVYKLCEYAGRGRVKLSAGKPILPGRKQVFRTTESGRASGDVIARAAEMLPGRALLRPVMQQGRRVDDDATDLERARRRAAEEIAALPEPVRRLSPSRTPYPVSVSDALQRFHDDVARAVPAE